MLMERLEEGALLSLLCLGSSGKSHLVRVLVGEAALLNAQKVVACSWGRWKKVLLLLMVLLSSPQQRKTNPSCFWVWVLRWCRSAPWVEILAFLPWDFFTLWHFLTDCSSWNRPHSLFPQVRTKKYLIKRRFKLWEKFHMKNCHFHWVTQWLFRKISSLTRIDGQGYNCRVCFPPKLPNEVIISLWRFLSISEIT